MLIGAGKGLKLAHVFQADGDTLCGFSFLSPQDANDGVPCPVCQAKLAALAAEFDLAA